MAKSDAIETTLNALAALRAGGKNATALVALTKALSFKANLVVKTGDADLQRSFEKSFA